MRLGVAPRTIASAGIAGPNAEAKICSWTPWFALPADFLLSADRIVQALHYGRHAGDQWSVDDLLAFRRLLDR
jgi:hypothetical protein